MHVGKRFLNTQVGIGTRLSFARIDAQPAHFTDAGVIDLNGGHQTELVIRWLESGVAFEDSRRKNQCFDQDSLTRASEHIICAGTKG